MANHSSIWQTTLNLAPASRGFHLISHEIAYALKAMPSCSSGMVNLFIQHTSASLCISENTCPDVRHDLECFFNHAVPEDLDIYTHTLEGSDDMPAHIKNVMLGASLNIPLVNGKLGLGQWQGLYLCEHRNSASSRTIIVTVQALFE